MSAGSGGDLGEAYILALEDYVAAPGESTLQVAYEIGRAAIASRLPMIDLVAAHQRTLARLLAAPSPIAPGVLADRAMQFLVETLSPFEMTLRGFRDAVARLEHEVTERAHAQAELKIAHDHLEDRVAHRTAELAAINERLRQEAADRERAEQALREVETSYESLVASVRDYGIFMLDPAGVVTTWNPGARRIKGYLAEEIIGRHFSVFYTAEDRAQDRPARVLARAIADGSCEDEGWRVRKDASRYWADVIVTARRSDDGTLKGFTKVTRDATERRHAQQALEDLNAELQRSNHEKDRFVAMISHELRNPLAAIVSGVEVLGRVPSEDERGQRALQIVRRNAAMQKRLVDDLIDFSRLRRDRLSLQRSPVALDSVAQMAVSGTEGDAARVGVTLALDADRDLWVVGDADRLQQVVLNLLSNAIKFTPSGGRIDVKVFPCERPVDALGPGVPPRAGSPDDRASVCLVVEDTGIGIDAKLLGTLFEPFQQGEIASERQSGLGLGLALVKLIAEKHGGAVWAESEGSNRGSRFCVAVPAMPAGRAADSVRHEGALRLLLLEDNRDTRALLTGALEACGYHVIAVGSGEEALSRLADIRPDLILSDIGLPAMSGYEFLKRARAVGGMDRLPAFAVTARALDEDLRHAREAGFDGHFVKPVDVRALDQAIRALFRRNGPPATAR